MEYGLILAAASAGAASAAGLIWALRRGGRIASRELARPLAALAASHDAHARAAERRLDALTQALGHAVEANAERAGAAGAEIAARLDALDRARGRIEGLAERMLGLERVLGDKQARGLYGEMRLGEIVREALPAGRYAFQATLSNGRRVDCLVDLGPPIGRLAVDAKFPLEGFRALAEARDPRAAAQAERAARAAVRTHIADIAERYVIPGETADAACLFLPSEAIFAELHSRFADTVREALARGVWIVSPTTLAALLASLRTAHRDAAALAEGRRLRLAVEATAREAGGLETEARALERRFARLEEDLAALTARARRLAADGRRLERFDREPAIGEPEAPAA